MSPAAAGPTRKRAFARTAWLLAAAWIGAPALLAHGALDEKIAKLTAQLAQRDDDPALHFALATVLCEHEESERGLAAIERVEALAPGRFATDRLRGQALLGLNQLESALAALNRAHAGNPRDPRTLRDRARVQLRLARTDAALDDYRAAARAMTIPQAELVGEIAAAIASHGFPTEALAVLEGALPRLGFEPALIEQAFHLERALGRTDAALARLDALQARAPRPEIWMAERAELLTSTGRTNEAASAWQTLRTHLDALPNLERGQPVLRAIAVRAERACAAAPPVTSPAGDAPRARSAP